MARPVSDDGLVLDEDLRRKRLGAWYTPEPLVDHVLDEVLAPAIAERPAGATVRLLDPACGDGRFLAAAALRVLRAGCRPEVTAIDIDPHAVASCRDTLGSIGVAVEAICADALAFDWGRRTFDVVLGNPPFLSPLAAMHGVRLVDRAGGPYADAAAEFLALCLRVVEPAGGRIGLVLPLSIVASRDAAPVRRIADATAPLDWFWFAPRPVFDAEVRTCAIGLVAGRPAGKVRRSHGRQFSTRAVVTPPSIGADSWSWLLTDQLGVPAVPPLAIGEPLGSIAVCTGDFRDEYYGLEGAVEEDDGTPGAPLITSGLIDVGRCVWGERPTKLHRRRYERPMVRTERLTGAMAQWATQRLVPKVLVASQTRVVEAVADPDGSWLPGVPVVSITPTDPDDVWRIAAVLTGPVPSVWLAHRASGTGMSASAMRVSAPMLAKLPLPAGDLDDAVDALRGDDLATCAALVTAAYGIGPEVAGGLLDWWFSASRVPRETPLRAHR